MPKGAIRIDWYPGDALDGMKFLTPMEELAYRRILDLIYQSGGELPDRDQVMAEQSRMHAEWPVIKASLMRQGKIQVADGAITNARCTLVLQAIETKSDKARASGQASGRARRQLLPSRLALAAGTPVNVSLNVAGNAGANGAPTELPTLPPTPEPTVPRTKAPAPAPTPDELSQVVKESVRVPEGTLTATVPDERWVRFACAYPNKDGITAAERDWRAAVTGGADPAAIQAGLDRWLAKWKRDKTEARWIPKPINWLRDRKWLDPIDGAASTVRRQWFGPAELRARVVAEIGADGEAFAKSYLDPAGWEAPSTVVARTGLARDKLMRLRALDGLTVTTLAVQGE